MAAFGTTSPFAQVSTGMTARHPISPFGSVVVKGSFGIRHRQGIVCSERSLTRMSSAPAPSTPASATRGSAPCRTSALDQRVHRAGDKC
jgi:hypothetical protein